LFTTRDGHEIVLALRGGGEIIGEIGGETGRRNATIQAVDSVKALIVRYDKFRSFLDTNLGADHAYRRAVTQRWTETDAMLRSRTGTSGAQRLARLLLDLAERHGHEVDGTIYVVMPLSQEELASLAGTSRATITRAFANWRDRGMIRTAPRRITILDLKGLRKVAGRP
jgi:CRP-like cAMP-binding protein